MAKNFQRTQAEDNEITQLKQQIHDLENQLDNIKRHPDTERPKDQVDLRQDEDLHAQLALRKGVIAYMKEYGLLVVLTGPVIYSTIFALVVLDVFLSLYQWICFPVYGIERVKRRDFIVIDRHHLAYLNPLETHPAQPAHKWCYTLPVR